MAQSDRALMPDYLRLIALFGIVVVNVQFIAFSVFEGFPAKAGDTTGDFITLWAVNGLALLKTYGLFSFMFGVGLGFLMRSAERRGLLFGKVYRNRMIGLLLLGLLHGCLFFTGDILVLYAITGSILYLFRNWPVQRLARVGIGLLLAQLIIATPLFLLPSDTPEDFIAFEQFALAEGGFMHAVIFRATGFLFLLPVFLFLQGISALGWFCLGLACVKSGMIDDAAHPLWQRARRLCLLPGVILSLMGAGLVELGQPVPGAILVVVAAPIATLGYLGLIALIARPPGPIMARALTAGGSSLSIYLGQSIILSTVFSAYGFGLWEEVSRLTAVAIAVGVTVGLIIALSVWRISFKLGPFEWILRKITYAGTHHE